MTVSYSEYLWTLHLTLEVLKHTGFETVKFTGLLTKSVETFLLFVPVNLCKKNYLSFQKKYLKQLFPFYKSSKLVLNVCLYLSSTTSMFLYNHAIYMYEKQLLRHTKYFLLTFKSISKKEDK